MNILNFKVLGLTCEACVKLASKRLEKIPGVIEVKLDLASGEARISSEVSLSRDTLAASLAGTDYSISQ